MIGKFLFQPYQKPFSSGKYTWTPEHAVFQHKIIILDFRYWKWARRAGSFRPCSS